MHIRGGGVVPAWSQGGCLRPQGRGEGCTCLVPGGGGVSSGEVYLPGPGGLSAPKGGVPAWSRGGCVCSRGVYLPGTPPWSWGGVCSGGCTCLVWGVCSWGVYLPGPGGVSAPGGVPAWSGGGVSAPGGVPASSQGGCTCLVRYPPPVNRMNDRRLWKYYLGQNFVSAGNNSLVQFLLEIPDPPLKVFLQKDRRLCTDNGSTCSWFPIVRETYDIFTPTTQCLCRTHHTVYRPSAILRWKFKAIVPHCVP